MDEKVTIVAVWKLFRQFVQEKKDAGLDCLWELQLYTDGSGCVYNNYINNVEVEWLDLSEASAKLLKETKDGDEH